jgi:DHA1 family multidrug resistance protein-like MFS transporter
MNLYISIIYGILYIWFEAFPIVFGEIHGFNPGEVGLSFLGILVSSCIIAIPAYFYWKWKYQSKHYDKNWNIQPEYQLPPACLGALVLPVFIFWFGWTGNFASAHWIVPIIASMLFAVGGCLVFNGIFTYLAHAYPKYDASALAGNDFMRFSVRAGLPPFATAMLHNLGVGWACTLLGCLCVLFISYPFVLYIYGKRIRLASKYARHNI